MRFTLFSLRARYSFAGALSNGAYEYRIFWPFGADQPLNAILCTDKHKIAYELLEVRTGHVLKTIYRTGFKPTGTLDALREEAQDALRKAFGEDGKAKRERVQALQNAVLNEWAEGGASKRDVLAFLDSL